MTCIASDWGLVVGPHACHEAVLGQRLTLHMILTREKCCQDNENRMPDLEYHGELQSIRLRSGQVVYARICALGNVAVVGHELYDIEHADKYEPA
jgi:hypothetical protein